MLSRQGHRLLQIGVALFLLTSFQGFVIPSLAAATSRAFSAFADGIVRRFTHSHEIAVAKASSRSCHVAAGVLDASLFESSNRRGLFTGRHLGSRQLHHAFGCGHCSRKRLSGDHHKNRGVLVRADRDRFFRLDSLGPSHWRRAIKSQLDLDCNAIRSPIIPIFVENVRMQQL
jgi:hypothetical protein